MKTWFVLRGRERLFVSADTALQAASVAVGALVAARCEADVNADGDKPLYLDIQVKVVEVVREMLYSFNVGVVLQHCLTGSPSRESYMPASPSEMSFGLKPGGRDG